MILQLRSYRNIDDMNINAIITQHMCTLQTASRGHQYSASGTLGTRLFWALSEAWTPTGGPSWFNQFVRLLRLSNDDSVMHVIWLNVFRKICAGFDDHKGTCPCRAIVLCHHSCCWIEYRSADLLHIALSDITVVVDIIGNLTTVMVFSLLWTMQDSVSTTKSVVIW